eukprot:2707526-Amphidinium_carterae.1
MRMMKLIAPAVQSHVAGVTQHLRQHCVLVVTRCIWRLKLRNPDKYCVLAKSLPEETSERDLFQFFGDMDAALDDGSLRRVRSPPLHC